MAVPSIRKSVSRSSSGRVAGRPTRSKCPSAIEFSAAASSRLFDARALDDRVDIGRRDCEQAVFVADEISPGCTTIPPTVTGTLISPGPFLYGPRCVTPRAYTGNRAASARRHRGSRRRSRDPARRGFPQTRHDLAHQRLREFARAVDHEHVAGPAEFERAMNRQIVAGARDGP